MQLVVRMHAMVHENGTACEVACMLAWNKQKSKIYQCYVCNQCCISIMYVQLHVHVLTVLHMLYI